MARSVAAPRGGWRQAAGRLGRCALQGMLLGGTTGAVYGGLAILVMSVTGGGMGPIWGVNTLAAAVPGAIFGGMLGAAGGIATGLVAGLLAAVAGVRLAAVGWWLGGALGGFMAAWVLQPNELSIWWHGCPAVIGSGAGAVFGRWVQVREARWALRRAGMWTDQFGAGDQSCDRGE